MVRVGQMQFMPIGFGKVTNFQFDPDNGQKPKLAGEHLFTADSQIEGQSFQVSGRVEPPSAHNQHLMVIATFTPEDGTPEITTWTPNIGDKNNVNIRSQGDISPVLAEGLKADTLELRESCKAGFPTLAKASFI